MTTLEATQRACVEVRERATQIIEATTTLIAPGQTMTTATTELAELVYLLADLVQQTAEDKQC